MNSLFELSDYSITTEFGLRIEVPTFRLGIGEMIGLAGRNGAGKSTLLRCWTKLLRSQRCPAYWCDLASLASLPAELSVSEVISGFSFSGGLSSLTFYPQTPSGEVRHILRSCLGSEAILFQKVKNLSDGERQIIALLCAISSGSKVIIFDETTNSMDEISLSNTLKQYEAFRRAAGVGIIMVAHNIRLFEDRFDRLYFVEKNGAHSRVIEVDRLPHLTEAAQERPSCPA